MDILEGSTLFDAAGDIGTFGDLLTALNLGEVSIELEGEGEGELQKDESFVAPEIKVETEPVIW